MPRTKSLQHYPDRYQEIIRECSIEGKQIRVPMESATKAASLRGHWYAFLGSLKAEASRAQRTAAAAGRMLTEGEQDIIHLAGLSASVMLQIEDAGGVISLVFQGREHSWQAKALAGAVVSQGAAPPSAVGGLDAMAQRLMQIQGEEMARPCPMCGEKYSPDELTTHSPCYQEAINQGGV